MTREGDTPRSYLEPVTANQQRVPQNEGVFCLYGEVEPSVSPRWTNPMNGARLYAVLAQIRVLSAGPVDLAVLKNEAEVATLSLPPATDRILHELPEVLVSSTDDFWQVEVVGSFGSFAFDATASGPGEDLTVQLWFEA